MTTKHTNARSHPAGISRRDFLRSSAAIVGAIGLGGIARAGSPSTLSTELPGPAASGIEHVVVVMMENRSFDHFLGWLPGADGRQAGLAYNDAAGQPHATHPLAPDYQGCGHPDPDHSYAGGRIEYAGGACNGWLLAGANDAYAIGYYTKKDLSFFGRAAPRWTVCDRYFAAIMAETFPNRFYQHAAQTDRIANTINFSTLPTIWDSLATAHLSGRYYFSDVPFLALWGTKYIPISRPFAAFLADCAAGTLPNVSFVDPRFIDESSGTSGDDHPHADIRNGEAFLNLVYTAVTHSPAWHKTLLVFNYDEWGGFFEHVPPPTAPIPPADTLAGNADGRLGFRVPCMLVAPFARRKYVDHGIYDHTSVLKLIEWRWGLAPLTVRDETATNLAQALDFSGPKLGAPQFDVPFGPFGVPCHPAAAARDSAEWLALRALAQQEGWQLP